MKLLFLSDTHGDLSKIKDNIDFLVIDLIILLGDNSIDDLEFLRNINKPKIGILGNHRFRGSDGNIGILENYGIIDISFKRYDFNGISFYGIDGNVIYQLIENIEDKNKKFNSINPNIIKEIENFGNKKEDLLKQNSIDFLISHFPIRGIMDGDSFSHIGLNLSKEFVKANHPKHYFHGHLHYNGEENLGNTKIIQVFQYLLYEF